MQDLGTLQATLAIKGAEEFQKGLSQAGETAEKTEEQVEKSQEGVSKAFEETGKNAEKSGQEVKKSFVNISSVASTAKKAIEGLKTVLKTIGDVAKKGIQVAVKSLQKLGSLAVSVGKKLKSGLESAFKAVLKSATALSAEIVALGTAFVKMINDTAELGDEIDKQSQKVGFSAEAYQVWDQVLQHCGADVSALGPAMKTLTKAVASDSEDITQAFTAIGLSQQELLGMSAEDQFNAVIAGLQGIGDEGERTRLAMTLLGKSGQELGPLLNLTAEQTENLKNNVYELGGVMSNEAVKASAEYTDALQNMKTAFSGIKNKLMADFLPSMTKVVKGLTSLFTGDWINGTQQIRDGIEFLVQDIRAKLPEVEEKLGGIVGGIADAIHDNLSNIVDLGADILGDFVQGAVDYAPQAIEDFGVVMSGFIDHLPEYWKTVLDGIPATMDSLAKTIGENGEKVIEAVGKIASDTAEKLPTLISSWKEDFPKMLGEISEKIQEKGKDIVKDIGDIFDQITDVDFLNTTWEGITDLGESLINSFEDVKWDEVGQKLFEKVEWVIEEVGPKLLSGLAWAGKVVGDILQGFSDKLNEGGLDTSGFITALETVLGEALRILKIGANILIEVAGNIITDLTTQFSNPKNTQITKVGNGIVELLNKAIKKVPELMAKLPDALIGIIDQIGTSLMNIDFSAIGEALASIIMGAIKLIPQLIARLPAFLKGLLDAGIALAKGLLKGIADGLTELPGVIMDALGSNMKGVDLLEQRMTELTQALSWDKISAEDYRKEIEGLMADFIEGGGTVVEFATALGNLQQQNYDLNEANQQVVAGLSDLVVGVDDATTSMDNATTTSAEFSEAIGGAGVSAVDMGTAIVEGAGTAEEAIDGLQATADDLDLGGEDKGQELTDGIAQGIQDGYPDVNVELNTIQGDIGKRSYIEQGKSIGKSIVIGIKNGIIAFEGNVRKWFQDLDTNIDDWTGDLSDTLKDEGEDSVKGFYDGADEAYQDEVEPFFRSLGDMVLDAIGDLGDLLYNAGYQMMAGMARGISEGSSEVINNAIQTAQEAVRQTETTLGINSPSKVFSKIGEFIDEGLAEGIADKAKGVFSTIGNLANGVVDAFNPQLTNPTLALSTGTYSQGGVAVGNNSATVYNIYIDGARVNDDLQIENKFGELFLEMARKGMM